VKVFTGNAINCNAVRLGNDLVALLNANTLLPRVPSLDDKGHVKNAHIDFDFNVDACSAFTSLRSHRIQAFHARLHFYSFLLVTWLA
jgi:hypothetical protein